MIEPTRLQEEDVYGDSPLIISQIQGKYRTRDPPRLRSSKAAWLAQIKIPSIQRRLSGWSSDSITARPAAIQIDQFLPARNLFLGGTLNLGNFHYARALVCFLLFFWITGNDSISNRAQAPHSHPVRIIYAIRTRTTQSPYGLPVLRKGSNSSPRLAGIGIPLAGQAIYMDLMSWGGGMQDCCLYGEVHWPLWQLTICAHTGATILSEWLALGDEIMRTCGSSFV